MHPVPPSYTHAQSSPHKAVVLQLAGFFALYCLLPYPLRHTANAVSAPWLAVLVTLGELACLALLLQHYWPARLRPYAALFWQLTLGYCLPYSLTLLVLLGHGIPPLQFAAALLTLAAFTSWKEFALLTTTAVALALGTYSTCFGTLAALGWANGHTVAYGSAFTLLLTFSLARSSKRLGGFIHTEPQQRNELLGQHLVEALRYQQRLAQGFDKEGVELLAKLHKLEAVLKEEASRSGGAKLTQASAELGILSTYIHEVVKRAKETLSLQVDTITVKKLLARADRRARQRYAGLVLELHQHTDHQQLQGDPLQLTRLLVSAIGYIHAHNPEGTPIRVTVSSTHLGYPLLSIKDHTKEVEALHFTITSAAKLPTISECYLADREPAYSSVVATTQELPRLAGEQITKAHYGVEEHYATDQGVTLVYVIPLRLRDIRPKSMDLTLSTIQQEDPKYAAQGAALAAQLLEQLQQRAPQVDRVVVEKAIKVARTYHHGQLRKSGEPFYFHPLHVALIVLDYTQEQDTLVAALLHDVVEDTPMSLAQLAAMFNPTVAALVDGVTNLDRGFHKFALSKDENTLQLLQTQDERILRIKLADRLHNMRTLGGHGAAQKRKEIARETLRFFISLGRQLGHHHTAEELEELSKAILLKP